MAFKDMLAAWMSFTGLRVALATEPFDYALVRAHVGEESRAPGLWNADFSALPRVLAIGDVHLGRITFKVDAPRAFVAEDMTKVERRRVEGKVTDAASGSDMLASRHMSEEELQQPLKVSVVTSRVATE